MLACWNISEIFRMFNIFAEKFSPTNNDKADGTPLRLYTSARVKVNLLLQTMLETHRGPELFQHSREFPSGTDAEYHPLLYQAYSRSSGAQDEAVKTILFLTSEQIVPDAPHQIRAADLASEQVVAALKQKGRPCRVDSERQISMFTNA
jgi:hypothetical protein